MGALISVIESGYVWVWHITCVMLIAYGSQCVLSSEPGDLIEYVYQKKIECTVNILKNAQGN